MESPFEGAAPYSGPLKTNTTAIVALIAAVGGFVCFFWGIGGILGITLGLIARSEVKRSEGREGGAGLALGAIVLGGLNLAVTVALFGVGIAQIAIASRKVTLPPTPVPVLAPPASPSPSPPSAAKPHRKPAERASRETTTSVNHIGAITLTDLADVPGELAANLDAQRADASVASETLLIWVVQPNCKPCDGLAAALPDPRMQSALAHVRLVRVDARVFQAELTALDIPAEKIPGFALLDAHNRTRDFIHGGEWDADIAANIAPILGKFVRGSYTHRREPWRSAPRDDETPI